MRSRPLLLGHRGARGFKSIPENTPASFDKALTDGCDGFEFDVRLAADKRAVVCHDPEFAGSEIARTAASELPDLPRLEGVLARYRERAFLDVELKVSGLEKIIANALRKFSPQRGFVVSSFLPEVLKRVYAEDAAIPLGLICEKKTELRRWSELPIRYLIPHHRLADRDLVVRAQAAGIKVLVWTVNARADMRRVREIGVDGIVSDKTELLCRTFEPL
jgi:glycerophosphoryl diester phosphodiesterase